jgi:hypothetical protein
MTMNTPIEPATSAPPAPVPVPVPVASAPRAGLPRWAWVLIVLLAVIALVATSVAVFAPRGRAVAALLRPAHVATSAPAPVSTSAPAVGTTLADGCLGGVGDPDQAVLAAQQQAPLTANGAAAFTAALARWAMTAPVPSLQAATARQVLSKDAAPAARKFPYGAQDLHSGLASSVSFTSGEYYVEASAGSTAAVSFLGTASASVDGVSQGTASVAATLNLVAVGGTWHLRDVTFARTIDSLKQLGLPYMGGC